MERYNRHRENPESDVERALDNVRKLNSPEALEAERVVEAERAAQEAERQDEEALGEVRRYFAAERPVPRPQHASGPHREDLYGAFASENRENGKIVLEGDVAEAANKTAAEFRDGAKYMTSTIVGERIAAEYDIRTNNFSTQTRISELPDGRKVFIVYDHRGSWLHRGLDGLMKRMNGLKMRKVSRAEWKSQFESKSTIPVIDQPDPDTVMMPFQPNANAYDIFANNDEVEDFGACGWAKGVDAEGKNELVGSLIDEVKRIHATDTAWGELILPNVIFTDDKRPIVCDPEVRYDEDLPLAEAKARDLKDLCISVAATLERVDGQAIPETVHRMLDRYGDSEVISELKRVAGEKRGLLKKLFFGYEKARTGVSGKDQYDAVLSAIASYEAE